MSAINSNDALYSYLAKVLSPKMYERLMRIKDPLLHKWIAEIVSIAKPSSVYVLVNDRDDIEYVKRVAIERGERS